MLDIGEQTQALLFASVRWTFIVVRTIDLLGHHRYANNIMACQGMVSKSGYWIQVLDLVRPQEEGHRQCVR